MIIKIPVYLDVESINQEDLPKLVEAFQRRFTFILRKEKDLIQTKETIAIMGDPEVEFKIITRKQAFEHLRTAK